MTYVIIGIIIIAILLVIICYNALVKLKNSVEKNFSNMDVYLKKRWDIIPNLINTVKGYTKHEEEILTKITNLRKKNYNTMSDEEKITNNEKLTDKINNIFAIAEAYPELKANQNFIELSRQLVKIEEDISCARIIYNESVTNLNNKISMFPSSIIASIFRFKKRKLYEITNKERQNIKVEF